MTRRNSVTRPARPVRRALTAAVVVVATASWIVLPAGAQSDISVNPNEVLRAEPGSTATVAEHPVAAELVGKTCELRIVAENGSSVHPGNVLVTTTGDSVVETQGVEDSSDGAVIDQQPVTLGETLLLQLRLGPEGLSSLGFTVAVDCSVPAVGGLVVEAEPEPEPEPEPEATTPTVLPAQQETPAPPAPPAVPAVGDPTFTG